MKEMLRHIATRLRLMGLMGVMGLMGIMGLTGCSDDSEHQGQLTMEAKPFINRFLEVEPITEARQTTAVTRGDAFPPSGYYDYSELFGAGGIFKNQVTNTNATICAFFTQGVSGFAENNTADVPAMFIYHTENNQWTLPEGLMLNGVYHVYGYVPKQAAGNAVLSGSNFVNGATLTLNNLEAVTPYDVCVIVGIKENEDVVTGSFKYVANVAKCYMLFDHIYSSIRFRFKVDTTYNELRTIKLKNLKLRAYKKEKDSENNITVTRVKQKVNATITFVAQDYPVSPISGDVSYENVVGSTDSEATLFDGNVVLHSSEFTEFLGCIAPAGANLFEIESTYDVYDKNVSVQNPYGNLIRENCTAVNTIDLVERFGAAADIARGKRFTLDLIVAPTYLYVLSDPDADNPYVVKINE